jgi:hypothetical protein
MGINNDAVLVYGWNVSREKAEAYLEKINQEVWESYILESPEFVARLHHTSPFFDSDLKYRPWHVNLLPCVYSFSPVEVSLGSLLEISQERIETARVFAQQLSDKEIDREPKLFVFPHTT